MNRSQGVAAGFLLAALWAGPVLADRAAAIAAECVLAEAAYAATVKAKGSAPNSVVLGCPGREALRDDTTNRQDRQRFAAAMKAPVPAGAAQYGKTGRTVFQRMIARGVPVEVATAMVATKAYRAAVAAVAGQ